MKRAVILWVVLISMHLSACGTFEGSYVETSAGYVLNVLFKKDNSAIIEGRLLETSAGYRADQADTYHLRDQQPAWTSETPSEDAVNVYFVGFGMPQMQDLEQGGEWSISKAISMAGDAAWFDVQKQVSVNIGNKISTDFQEKINEVKKRNHVSSSEKKQITVELEREEKEEAVTLESWSQSSSSFQGLQKIQVYYERYEGRTSSQARIEYIKYWVLSAIPREKIEEAREEIRQRESLAEREKRYFEELKKQYDVTIADLSATNFSTNERVYIGKYTDLLNINTRLRGLSTFNGLSPSIDDQIKDIYFDLLDRIEENIKFYDPTDKQKQEYQYKLRTLQAQLETLQKIIDDRDGEIYELKMNNGGVINKLEKELALKDSAIQALEQQKNVIEMLLEQYTHTLRSDLRADIEGLQKQGVTLVSQNILMSFPLKPNEVLVRSSSSSPYLVADNMVTNRDYISFAVSHGKNSFAMAEQGLDRAAVSVSWQEAVSYCNWLSQLYGLRECYSVTGDTVGFDKNRNGYRLPTKAEIIAALEQGSINPSMLRQIRIWSSEDISGSTSKYAYRLAPSGSARSVNYAADLEEQSLGIMIPSKDIGFLVVRNAQ